MRLLYIEDTPMNAKVLSMYVRHLWDVQLEIAVTAEDGLNKIQTIPYDLIFMDINLPKMNGIEATQCIKEDMSFSQMPILIVSADATEATKTLALSSGASGYLTKPVNIGNLKDAVESLIETS